ncbi:MAG: hypothetical protein C7B45_03465 [Sulfobacillus acidophilus]|uniref:Uncharacterized protein n=1 Tax=Sulfobacillus acidophilus TaxID=53633 RepID=A0A2T2WMB4_9FIRM|nr:MAG: hypothetical protein C7B45_03465 [Sulfobacillus acidophilus]
MAIPHATGLYVLVYAENPDCRRIWRSLPGVSDYGYQDSTDPPDDISPARWAELLGSSHIPAQVGLTIDVYNPLIEWEDRFWAVQAWAIPDYAQRVRR